MIFSVRAPFLPSKYTSASLEVVILNKPSRQLIMNEVQKQTKLHSLLFVLSMNLLEDHTAVALLHLLGTLTNYRFSL